MHSIDDCCRNLSTDQLRLISAVFWVAGASFSYLAAQKTLLQNQGQKSENTAVTSDEREEWNKRIASLEKELRRIKTSIKGES